MKRLSCLIPFLLAATAYAAPPASSDPPAPVAPPFILPVTPPTPPNPPPPNTPIQLTAGKPFIIRLNSASVQTSPKGLLQAKTKAEPATIIDAEGNAVDYTGDKSICSIWPAKGASGPGEIIISQGNADGTVTELARVSVVVGTPPPPPPPPGPTDPLAATLQAAYAKDADVDRAKSLAFLAGVYGAAGAILTPDVKTNADLFAKLSAVIHAPVVGIPKGGMVNLIAAIGAELNASFGTSASAAIDATKAKAEFGRISQSLSEVK